MVWDILRKGYTLCKVLGHSGNVYFMRSMCADADQVGWTSCTLCRVLVLCVKYWGRTARLGVTPLRTWLGIAGALCKVLLIDLLTIHSVWSRKIHFVRSDTLCKVRDWNANLKEWPWGQQERRIRRERGGEKIEPCGYFEERDFEWTRFWAMWPSWEILMSEPCGHL